MRAIEVHLARHPQAADSAMGIGVWWLEQKGLVAPPQRVENALRALVRLGRMEMVELPGGTVLYAAVTGPVAAIGRRVRHRRRVRRRRVV